jgi:2-amino-4-hydroxy-6-hydroxymethyldihydropteridine diphosphokinase
VAVGSNLQQPEVQVRNACEALVRLPQTRVELTSSLYGSEPFGPVPQPRYVNAVVGLLTQLEAPSFFDALRALETALGRQRPRERWGPRLIDLDLLMFSRDCVETPELTLPHPGIVQRNFVLYPLREIAPELTVPGRGRVDLLAARVDPTGIWRLDEQTITHDA